MTFTSSKLKYCVQKTTIQKDVGLRIYYFAYMNSPPRFRVPSILRSCYSNYELKMIFSLRLASSYCEKTTGDPFLQFEIPMEGGGEVRRACPFVSSGVRIASVTTD